jgi:hypothetical protein
VRVDQRAQVFVVAGLLFRRRVRQRVRQHLADHLAHLVRDALLIAVVQVIADLRGFQGRRKAGRLQHALRLLGLADHQCDLLGVGDVHVQAGGEEVADRPLAQRPEQGRLAGVAPPDAAGADLAHVQRRLLEERLRLPAVARPIVDFPFGSRRARAILIA